MGSFTTKEIKESKAKAFAKIKEYLEAEDVAGQFTGDYFGAEKVIVSWIGNYKGTLVEYRLDHCDSFYTSYSGYKVVFVRVSLFQQKQISGYQGIHRALVDVAYKHLCPKEESDAFFQKYITRFNALVEKQAKEKSEQQS
jgi:hypothetical protein